MAGNPVAFIPFQAELQGMPDVLAKSLSDKAVIGTDGAEIGSLYNITMDFETGQLEHIIVSPAEEGPSLDFETDERGRYLIPHRLVESVKDHLVVSL